MLAAPSCGGSDEAGLFGSAGNGGKAGSGGAGGASGGAGSAGLAGVGGIDGGAGAAGQAGAAGAAGSGGLAGEGGAAGSAASGGTGGTIQKGIGPCGQELCSFELGASCCDSATKGLYCSNPAAQNPCTCTGIGCKKLEIHCDGPEDCMLGSVCCAETGLVSAGYSSVSCKAEAQCQSDVVTTRRQLCHPNGLLCPGSLSCTADGALPPGYSTCQ